MGYNSYEYAASVCVCVCVRERERERERSGMNFTEVGSFDVVAILFW